VVTNNSGKADFVIVLDHEGGKGGLRHRNKIAVFNHLGDDIFSDSTRELGNAIKDACRAMDGQPNRVRQRNVWPATRRRLRITSFIYAQRAS
jgi:hypothetical protein